MLNVLYNILMLHFSTRGLCGVHNLKNISEDLLIPKHDPKMKTVSVKLSNGASQGLHLIPLISFKGNILQLINVSWLADING